MSDRFPVDGGNDPDAIDDETTADTAPSPEQIAAASKVEDDNVRLAAQTALAVKATEALADLAAMGESAFTPEMWLRVRGTAASARGIYDRLIERKRKGWSA